MSIECMHMTVTKPRFVAGLIVSVLSLLTITASAADWPCYRGPDRNGRTMEKITIWPPREVWRAIVGAGYSQVVVSHGKVYTAGWVGNLNAIYCFNESSAGTNPAPSWTGSYSCGTEIIATPTVDGNEVYLLSPEGRLSCWDAATGTTNWFKDLGLVGRPQYGFGSSPLIEGNLVIVNMGGRGYAVDKTQPGSHDIMWGPDDTGAAGYASPFAVTIGAQRTVVVFGGSKVSGVDPANGQVLWYFGMGACGMADPIVYSNLVWASIGQTTRDCRVVTLGSGQLTPLWNDDYGLGNCENCSVLYNGYVYGICDKNLGIWCVDITNDQVKWTSGSLSLGTESSVILANDELVVLTGFQEQGLGLKSGDLLVVPATPTGYSVTRQTNVLSGTTWIAPTLSNGRLYVRNAEGTLICYQVGSSLTGVVQFASSTYSVAESGVTANIMVTRTNGNSGTITVDYATMNGTATAGSDYTAVSGMLTFADGETNKTITVPIFNDSSIEPTETVNLTLTNPTGGATLGSPSNAVLSIIDDDTPSLQFSSPTYSVAENGGSISIQVMRLNDTSGSVSVSYATVNGTAKAGSDYTAASGTLNLGIGETSKTFSVQISNDFVFEGDRTVNLVLSNPSVGAMLGSVSNAVLTIVDDEQPATTFGAWHKKVKITFSGYGKSETLTNFPALAVLNTNISGFAYDQFTSASGGDLRFADSTETNALNFEIEQWSTGGNSYVWVQVPQFTNNCYVWAYWGNSATNLPAYATNGATWIADFRGVWHLGEANGATSHFDSTANGNNATTNGTTSMGTPGVVDGAAAYTGGGIGRITNMNSSLTLTGKVLTVGIWLQPTANLNQAAKVGFLGKLQESGGNGGDYGLFYDWTAVHFAGGGMDFSTGYDPPINTWSYLVGVCDGNYTRLYVNGVQRNSAACSGNTPNTSGYSVLLAGGDNGGKLNGMLDEGRIMAVAASSNWVWASYMTMGSNASFATYGTVQAGTGGGAEVIMFVPAGMSAGSTGCSFSWCGAAGATNSFKVYRSTNLIAGGWQLVAPNIARSGTGTNIWTDTNVFPQAFYRVAAPNQ
jgi:hypothetical protein